MGLRRISIGTSAVYVIDDWGDSRLYAYVDALYGSSASSLLPVLVPSRSASTST
jgi:hypothetical protein